MGTRSARLLLLVVSLLVSGALCNVRRKRIIGGQEAAVPPEDDPVVMVLKEDHDATVYGLREQRGGFYSFRGLRYAEPPVERYRFQRSRRLRLEGDVNATGNGAPCPQINPDGGGVIGSEDCLFLNVYSAELPGGGEGLPVVVWIHGGGFRRGSASQYGPRHLVDKKLVVVTIQYRLGSLGFLSTGLQESPGNVAMFDMTLALEWVNEYISFFGGNPNKVTISGQDTGASAAILLSLSNSTKGYLGGVIAMSGSALSSFAVDSDPTETCRGLAAQNNCPTTPVLEMVRCLQQLPIENIIEADSQLQSERMNEQGIISGLGGLLGTAPVVDGGSDMRFITTFMTKTPLELLNSGFVPGIPLLTGVTKDQTSTAILGGLRAEVENRIQSVPEFFNSVVNNLMKNSVASIITRPLELTTAISKTYFNLLPIGGANVDEVKGAVQKIVEASGDALFNLPAFQTARLWSQKSSAFFYSFDHVGKKKGGPSFLRDSPLTQFSGDSTEGNTGVGHGDELLFMFESFSVDGSSRDDSLELEDPDDVKVRDTFSNMISQFATFGSIQVPSDDPNERKPWPSFGSSSGFVSITDKPSIGKDFRFCEMALWAGLGDRLQSLTCQALDGIKALSSGVLSQLGVGNMTGLDPVQGVGAAVGNVQSVGEGVLGLASGVGNVQSVGGGVLGSAPGAGNVQSVAAGELGPAPGVQNVQSAGGDVLGPATGTGNVIQSVIPLGKPNAKPASGGGLGINLVGGASSPNESPGKSILGNPPKRNNNRGGGGFGLFGG